MTREHPMKTPSQALSHRLPITVVVPVLNEELNLPAALASVAWADEIFVVDSGSTDDTARRAADAGAEVVSFFYEGKGPRKKAWALANLEPRNPWVFLLDADERVPEKLRDEIAQAIERDDYDGWYVDREFIFMGVVFAASVRTGTSDSFDVASAVSRTSDSRISRGPATMRFMSTSRLTATLAF